MATILCNVNGSASGKPRVYFTCHPDDFDRYFQKICDDIFKTHDVAIYYTEDMTEAIPEEDRETDLGSNNLFVVPVTFRLLSTPNRAMDSDIPYALEQHIPILPFMMEPEIDAFYAKKFGELQYLNPYSTDLTEVRYEDKLKKYLESVLISDETAKRVRDEFDAHIFLSYRKKDRRFANRLMKDVHKDPRCRDIAIWYDEFLTPGESFKENIEKNLKDSDLFTLLVTPQLFETVRDNDGKERENYVMSTEIPLAKDRKTARAAEGKTGEYIFPVEMEEIADENREVLQKKDLPESIRGTDEVSFRGQFVEQVSKLGNHENNDSPEHNFLIGLAYLEGIDVEVDRQRGVELITSAAEAEHPEAMKKLYEMYNKGQSVTLDYRKAALWAEKLVECYTRKLGPEDPMTLSWVNDLACVCSSLGEYRKDLELSEKTYALRCKVLGEEDPETLRSLNNLALAYGKLGDRQKALELCEKTYRLRCKVLGEEHPDALISLHNLATACETFGDYKKTLELCEKTYALRCKILGKKHPDTLLSRSNLAVTYYRLGDRRKALEIVEQTYALYLDTLGEEHPDTLASLSDLATAYRGLGNDRKALELGEKAYTLRCKILGETHPDTLTSLTSIATDCTKAGDHARALELLQKVYTVRCSVLGVSHS